MQNYFLYSKCYNVCMELTLVYEGVIYSKKNSKQIVGFKSGHPRLISSKNARCMEQLMSYRFKNQSKGVKFGENDLCKISIELYRKNNTRRDLDNTTTSILDGLVASGVIYDDNWKNIKSLYIEDKGVDKDNPRAVINIRKVN